MYTHLRTNLVSTENPPESQVNFSWCSSTECVAPSRPMFQSVQYSRYRSRHSSRVSVNFLFYLSPNFTKLAKYTHLHTNLVLTGDSPEAQLNLSFMIIINSESAKSLFHDASCPTECAAPSSLTFQLVSCVHLGAPTIYLISKHVCELKDNLSL
ncbi:hypothetical protein CSKR_103093, partial [Clonorchis sinensis]